jgi:competence protein ComFC
LSQYEIIICRKCLVSIERISIIENIDKNQFKDIHYLAFDKIFYYSRYSNLMKDLIHLFKYSKRKELAKPLARLLLIQLNDIILLGSEYDYILYIPLHRTKLRERGFNQSYLIANELSLLSDIPILKDAIVRYCNSKSQTKLKIRDRYSNVANVFSDGKGIKKIINKRILLIDDVVTTGSTLNEASLVLKKYNPSNITCLTLASAVRRKRE